LLTFFTRRDEIRGEGVRSPSSSLLRCRCVRGRRVTALGGRISGGLGRGGVAAFGGRGIRGGLGGRGVAALGRSISGRGITALGRSITALGGRVTGLLRRLGRVLSLLLPPDACLELGRGLVLLGLIGRDGVLGHLAVGGGGVEGLLGVLVPAALAGVGLGLVQSDGVALGERNRAAGAHGASLGCFSGGACAGDGVMKLRVQGCGGARGVPGLTLR
ncbi:unnamed protein product, partial [Pelagomonas calceolata]